jgi:hypothetical protein
VTAPTPDSTATFGPRGAAVSAVISRAGRLTPDEVEALGAAELAVVDNPAWRRARGALWCSAWFACRADAWHATMDATADAVSGAARHAAWRRARDAAADAALAELGRDLLTQEQYDILAGPWNSVIGPVAS